MVVIGLVVGADLPAAQGQGRSRGRLSAHPPASLPPQPRRFVEQHPGGAARLMLAAGGAIDPFWAMYQQHNTGQVGASAGPQGCGGLHHVHAPAAAVRVKCQPHPLLNPASPHHLPTTATATTHTHGIPQVRGILEEYRIGRLKGGQAAPVADPYAGEPARHPALIVRSQKPMNSGARGRGRLGVAAVGLGWRT